MIIDTLRKLFKRDLGKLRIEIEHYSNENVLWKTDGNILNSGGNLCLHLTGNLNAYIGAELGKTGYIRNRVAEFSLKNVPKSQLLAEIDNTISVVDTALSNLSIETFEKEYPLLVFETKTTTGYFLMHLASHLSYHLGQINYHRRLFDV